MIKNKLRMKIILRNILAVVAGLVLGSAVNMALVTLGPHIIPPPPGGDISTMEGLKETMHLFKPLNFLFPFLAHALGTLVGALLAALIATRKQMWFAVGIGLIFLLGGIQMVMELPSPLWFNILDLAVAYVPMGWLGGWIGMRRSGR
jgi:hypothetical protein